jgi:ribose/xylose/arabinose/galactoside ABC-type transport system permease subunit
MRAMAMAFAVEGIVVVGMTILLISGEFDLSAGAIFVLAGIVAAFLFPLLGTGTSLMLGVLAAIAIGVINGVVVTYLGVNSFIATLATSLMIVGLGTLISNGFQLYVSDPGFGQLGNGTLTSATWRPAYSALRGVRPALTCIVCFRNQRSETPPILAVNSSDTLPRSLNRSPSTCTSSSRPA